MKKTCILITLYVFSCLHAQQPPVDKAFTQEDFKKITINCDIVLENVGILYREIKRARQEQNNNPDLSTGLSPLIMKIKEIEFMALYITYKQLCMPTK
jgi:ABC-type transport system involved in Fe-S cluster assembly fused permease/ATPase subunit